MSDTHTVETNGQTAPLPNGNGAQFPAVQATPRRQEVRVVNDPIPVLDTGRFEHMQRVAQAMASCTFMPDALCKEKDGEGKLVWLPDRQILSNCFMVVNQAVRWGMDPFAVAQCVSVVHGKLCYEGKLIAAVISAKLGFDLEYKIEGQGESMKVTVTAAKDGKKIVDSDDQPKKVEGTVADWKTTNSGSPWAAKGGFPRMLRYRGAREWCRVHAPALMLGVYSDDEMEENDRRFASARDITPGASTMETVAIAAPRKAPPPPGHVQAEPEIVVESPSTAPVEADAVKGDLGTKTEASDSRSTDKPKKAPPPPAQSKPQQEDGVPDFLRREAEPKKTEAAAENVPPVADAKAFLAWVDQKLSAIPLEFSDAFEAIVDGEIRSRMEGIFPADRDEIEGLIRKHEARLAP